MQNPVKVSENRPACGTAQHTLAVCFVFEKFEKSRKKLLKFGENSAKFWMKTAKISAIFNENFAIRERCKGVHCVDLGESFPTSIYLQNLASIQPRTSSVKFARSPRTDPPVLDCSFPLRVQFPTLAYFWGVLSLECANREIELQDSYYCSVSMTQPRADPPPKLLLFR